jgi:hypothetical protein
LLEVGVNTSRGYRAFYQTTRKTPDPDLTNAECRAHINHNGGGRKKECKGLLCDIVDIDFIVWGRKSWSGSWTVLLFCEDLNVNADKKSRNALL